MIWMSQSTSQNILHFKSMSERSSCFPKIDKTMLWHCCLFQMFLWFFFCFWSEWWHNFQWSCCTKFQPSLVCFWNVKSLKHTHFPIRSFKECYFVSLWDFLIPARNKIGNRFLVHFIKLGMKELENYPWYIIILLWDNYKKISRHPGNLRFPKCIQMVGCLWATALWISRQTASVCPQLLLCTQHILNIKFKMPL